MKGDDWANNLNVSLGIQAESGGWSTTCGDSRSVIMIASCSGGDARALVLVGESERAAPLLALDDGVLLRLGRLLARHLELTLELEREHARR
eukprot:5818893-Pleurochrysis_carterae.AAC.1